MGRFFGLLLFVLLCSCGSDRLYVQTMYISHEDLASVYVSTPDVRKECPDIGQRLLVHWCLDDDVAETEELLLRLLVRYGDQEEREIVREISDARGILVYELLNDEYELHCGILAYRAEIIADGRIIEEWVHQVWADRIRFGSD